MFRRNLIACVGLALGLSAGISFQSKAEDKPLAAEIQELKREVEALRKEKASSKPMAASSVDKAIDNKYGPNAAVTTKEGKLTVGGLIQVWYQHIQNDNHGQFYDPKAFPGVSNLPMGNVNWFPTSPITRTYLGPTGANAPGATQMVSNISGVGATTAGNALISRLGLIGGGTDEIVDGSDNDTYKIRRTELRFQMDIHENVQGVVMIDPAREITYSQSNFAFGSGFKGAPANASVTGVQSTAAGAGFLQDAYIKIHKLIPHHESQTGQFKPPFGEEGFRSNGELDFAERSWIGNKGADRDLGSMIRGFWWDDRFQYWAGVFNGAGDFHGTRGQYQNRGDSNDEKDFIYRVLVRPVWKNETWGSLELGFSHQFGKHGESLTNDLGRNNVTTSPIVNGVPGTAGSGMVANDFNGATGQQLETNAYRMAAWFSYKPGSVVRGWWIKGEWGMIHDTPAENSVMTPFISSVTAATVAGTAALGSPSYAAPNYLPGAYTGRNISVDAAGNYYVNQTVAPLTTQGFYLATGYKLSDSIFKDKVPFWMKPIELTYRFDHANNVILQDQNYPQRHLNTFYTDTHTIGLNYYIKGHNAKFQLNYNIVKDPTNTYFVSDGSKFEFAPEGTHYKMHALENNSLVANFQVMW